ncbi:MAG: PQQ-like beta-propeller repeat protein [Sedimentisphaerales bacterium]|nr:PQQ-like beta-propeller repeat protein [Sedimentisphaerales bacterium]
MVGLAAGFYLAAGLLFTPAGGKVSAAEVPDGMIGSPEPGWPQWRGSRRDGVSPETGLLSSWPADGPELIWKISYLGQGWSSPIVVAGRIYITGDVGDELLVFALDTDGNEKWWTPNGRAWKKSYPGARAGCTYARGRLYHLNAHGRLACLDAATGREWWAVDILERFEAQNVTWALSENLLVDNGRVIVTPGGKKVLLAALDGSDGRTLWTTPPTSEDRTSYCSPILFSHAGRRLIASCSAAYGFGVDADTGALLWTVPLRNSYGVNVTAPVYDSGRLFYMTSHAQNGNCYRLQAEPPWISAEPVWTCPLDTVTGGAILVDGTLFAAGYGKVKWWLAVDWLTGQTRAEYRDLTTGAAVYADGRLYCLDDQGTVALLRYDPDGFHLAGRFPLVQEKLRDAWAHPVLHDGRLYLRYHDTLWCYRVKRP